jgi:glycerol-3-phosphate acyltransferase PlsY
LPEAVSRGLAVAIGYLAGSTPSADIASRLATRGRIDLREAGSGNPGALNAAQVLGRRWGLTVLAADVAKGTLAGVLGRAVAGDAGAYAAATAAIAGHIAPPWSGFRGGKGVATSAGTCLAVFPAYFPIDMAVAGMTAYRSRQARRSVTVACAIWTGAALLWWRARLPNLWGPEPGIGLVAFAFTGSAMILWRFREAPVAR